MTNAAPPLNVEFIGRVSDESLWAPLAVIVGGHKLAARLSTRSGGSKSKKEAQEKLARDALKDARWADSKEGSKRKRGAGRLEKARR